MAKTLILSAVTFVAAAVFIWMLMKLYFFCVRESDLVHKETREAERALREAEEDLERAIRREEKKRKNH